MDVCKKSYESFFVIRYVMFAKKIQKLKLSKSFYLDLSAIAIEKRIMSSESKMSEESHAIVPASTTTTERATEITTTMSNQYGLTTQQMNFLTDPSFIDGLNPSSPDFVTRVAETVTQRILESRNLSSTSLIEDQAESQLITSQLQSVQMVTGRRIPQRISEVIQN